MAGGLFAINREYFKNILYYDPGLEVWGGENFELSYKLWMCGGGMLFTPCSRSKFKLIYSMNKYAFSGLDTFTD